MNKCPHCDNTGSLAKTLEGHLDCAHCGIAELRARLAFQLNTIAPAPGAVRDWAAYLLGRRAALDEQLKEQAAA